MSSEDLLRIEGISVAFGGVEAVKSVSLSVKSGQFVGLMGPNGAGKTSVINCVSRLVEPKSGKIEFEGKSLLKTPGHAVGKLGIARTFQDLNFFSLVPNMLIIDYLKLGQFQSFPRSFVGMGFQLPKARECERELERRARRVLEFLSDIREELEMSQEDRGFPSIFGREGFPDLLDVEHSPIGILSFAWRRRLDLARVLVTNPKLLLLDEPAQGIPPSEFKSLGKLLKMIQAEFGVAALIVEHNISTLMDISDRIVAMDSGRVIAEGLPDEVRSNPLVIQTYLGASEVAAKEMAAIDETDHSAEVIKSSQPILEVRNLDLFYGSAQALFSVSMKLYPGLITCFLGTNGSGKSTLLKTISGIEKPSAGEIFMKGAFLPLGWPEHAVQRGIQYVPQGHQLFPRLTVAENLEIGAISLRARKLKPDYEKIYYFFPELKNITRLRAVDLSGGQQQMVAIAQALMGRPEVLLLDEPSLGLAPKYVESLFSVIQKIAKQERVSILLVEQNVAKSVEISDYIFMLSAGVVVGEGTKRAFANDDSIIRKNLGFY